jgi:phosphopantetheinyl transferase
MPLYKEWSPDGHSLAAIWHIEEEESFFQIPTGLNPDIKHPRRRIEHLAGRYLLQYLKVDFPLHHIVADEHDKPRLPENRYFFSISHSHPYVAALISDREECGIDIQVWHKRIETITHMFLSEGEQQTCMSDPRLITLAWSIKEAVYKWNGRRGADFIRDLPIQALIEQQPTFYQPAAPIPFALEMQCFHRPVMPTGFIYKDFVLAYLVGDRVEL